ncbi:MAG: queuosine precursor transporter [Aeropyrum sp.]|nr:queuosine precursor transporter [Aeropyrum sp.]MCE4616369.1 queuosine precursor transporter [Aeropyrum sp.]
MAVDEEGLGRRVWPLILLSAVFAVALVTANFLSVKLFQLEVLGLLTLAGPAGVVAYSVTFIATDVVSEVYGRRAAAMVVKAGFAAQIVAVLLTAVALASPAAPFTPVPEEEYRKVLTIWGNIIIASLIAYLVSQYHDVWAFHLWRRLTGGRWLWLRNNLSTTVSQLIDTVIFLGLAFYVIPALAPSISSIPEPVSLAALFTMFYSQYIIKLSIALLDTPIVYAVVHIVKAYMGGGLEGELARIGRLGHTRHHVAV